MATNINLMKVSSNLFMQDTRLIIFSTVLTLLLSCFPRINDANDLSEQKLEAKHTANIVLDWRPWERSNLSLCEEKPKYCHCGGYFQEEDIISIPDDTDLDSLFGISDNYEYNFNGTAKLEGDIILRHKELQVSSETMTINRVTELTQFTGNVELRYPGILIYGPSAVFNLKKDEATLNQANFISHNSSLHGSAKKILIKNKERIQINDGKITSCAPLDNAWHIRGKKINLDFNNGWGSIHQMQVRAKDIPMLYVPYFTFPLDDRRKSGFLYPQFNLSEPDLSFPYYVNLAPNYDATLTPRYIGGRGSMIETEFRYLKHLSEGEFQLDYLSNDDTVNDSRKLFSWQHKSELDDNWLLNIDANYISDNNYFNDLGNSLTENSASHLKRLLTLENTKGNWQFFARLESYQTIDDTIAEEDFPYRRLPDLRLNHAITLGKTDVRWQNQFNYVYFAQPRAITSRYAHRGVWQTTLDYPQTWQWGYSNASIGLHQRYYQLSNESLAADEEISIPITSLDTGLFFERYTSNFISATDFQTSQKPTWQHTLEPRLFFVYVPNEDQTELPNFDSSDITLDYHQLFQTNRFTGEDRIGDSKQISLGITQRLYQVESGHEWANFSLGQAFYLNDRKVALEESEETLDQPRSPVFGLLELNDPNHGITWQTQFTWNEQVNLINSARTGFSWSSSANRLLNFSYSYRTEDQNDNLEPIKQSELSFAQRIHPKWLLLGKVHYDLNEKTTLEHIAGIKYESCCWQTTFVYHQQIQSTDEGNTDFTENDYAFFVEIQLKSLGGLGGGISKFLETQIPGYTNTGI